MRPRRTKWSNCVYSLVGGTEDNDLWVHKGVSDGTPFIESVWELSDEDRQRVVDGENIAIRTIGNETPPLAAYVTPMPVGKGD